MKNRKLDEYKGGGGKSAGVFYSAIIFSLIILTLVISVIIQLSTKSSSYQETNWYQYLSYGMSSVAIIITIAIGVKLSGESPKSFSIRFTIDAKSILIVALIFFGMIFGLSKVNDGFVWVFKKIGYEPPQSNVTNLNAFLSVLIIALLPAIFEELLFRGFILHGLKTLGEMKAILLSAFLFSLYHLSPAQTAYQFIVGVLFALLALKSKSVLPTMITHFLNNAFIILNEFYFHIKLGIALDVVLTIVGLIAIGIALFLLLKTKKKEIVVQQTNESASLKYNAQKDLELTNENKTKEQKLFFVYALPGIVAALVMWVASFF